jgi:DNA-binding transcriptional LysR family regulator
MNYTFHQLQVFLEVVRQESVTKAAEELHMTQPALSIQLKNFQGHFDVPLTEVIGRRLHITDFGRSIAEMAENVLLEAESIHYKTKEYSGLHTGKLRIVSASTGKYVIPYYLTDFLEQHSGIDLILDVNSKAQVIESLRNKSVDFALVSIVPDDLELEEEWLLENRLYLVGNQSKLDPDQPFIYRERGSATRQVMDHYMQQHVGARRRIELTSNEAIKQAVIAGLGYSIIPLIGLHNELDRGGIHIIETEGLPITTDWRLVWNKHKKLSPVAMAFIEHIRNEKDRIAKQYFSWYLNYR